MYEDTRRHSLSALFEHYKEHPIKGEIVIIVAGKKY